MVNVMVFRALADTERKRVGNGPQKYRWFVDAIENKRVAQAQAYTKVIWGEPGIRAIA